MVTQKGFTLIELMITLAIIAVIAAIAIPSYRQYIIRNAESQAQARLSSLQLELDKWRASTLTYKGFTPKKVDNTFGYDDGDTVIYAPMGATASTAKYTITLVNGDGNSLATVPNGDLEAARNSTSWVMLAVPTDKAEGASRMLMTSTGQRCKTIDDTFCASDIYACTCTTTEQSW